MAHHIKSVSKGCEVLMKIACFYYRTKYVASLGLDAMSMPFDEFPINIMDPYQDIRVMYKVLKK
ncbi:MAG: hypothetical protein N2B06_06100 [Clostridium sp.]